MSEWFGTSWRTVGFIIVSTAAIYASVLAGVRLAGRRTLAQLSAFDAVVTIALGSMLATTALSPSPSYGEGLTAVVTLLTLQVLVGALRRRFPSLRRLTDFDPVPLIEGGARRRQEGVLGPHLTDEELRSALRAKGYFDISAVRDCILEPTGEVSARGPAAP
ncbi:MAG TPA: YetF domain-containing protein [Acidimicrobiales bacterium]|nr:YetF domain-containing protein [Acidimicrobiales bacterium]